MRASLLAWGVLVLACAGDVLTTWVGVEGFGLVEGNTAMAWILAHAGVAGLVAVKLCLVAPAGVLMMLSSRGRSSRWWIYADGIRLGCCLAAGVSVLACARNLWILAIVASGGQG